VPVADLSLPQAAYLVGLLKAPTALNRDPEAAKARSEAVFDAMLDNGKLDPEQRTALVPVLPRIESRETVGSYYADWVASTAGSAQRQLCSVAGPHVLRSGASASC
jgi:membrane peptidoglycan carboxypeptidase